MALPSRDEAFDFLRRYVKSDKLIKHCLAVEAIMKELAKYLGENVEVWGLTGLLHDIDYETVRDMSRHGLVGAGILEKENYPSEMIEAVKRHNYLVSGPPTNKLERCLVAADSVSGLIIAAGLMMPDKRLKTVTVKTIKKKFKDKSFARGCNREEIKEILKVGLTLDEFFGISLKALQKISSELEL